MDGIPAPNSYYEIPVENVTGNANVKRQNKNLFDIDNLSFTNGYYDNNGNLIANNNNGIFDYIKVKPNTDYTFSVTSNVYNISIVEFDSSKNYIKRNNLSNVKEETVTLENNTAYIRIGTNLNNAPTVTKQKVKALNPQLEVSSTATAYVPYQEQNLPFTFAEGQFLADDEKLQDNGMHKKWKQVTFSGTTATLSDAKTNGAYYCNKKASGNLVGQTLTFDEEVTDAIIQYELAQPTTIAYNSTQQAQYEAIKNARSNADVTYITSTSDEEGFDMSVVAIGDINKAIESLQS